MDVLPDFTLDADGWSAGATHSFSPNFDFRPGDGPIDLLVIHNISLPPRQFGGGFIRDLFLNQLDYTAHPYFEQLRPLRVSAHFVIGRDGRVEQFVSTENRAWHAGVSQFQGRERCNDNAIGIELEGSDFEPFTPAQYAVLAALSKALVERYALSHVVGHEHIAPGRKTDPGPFFDWHRYHSDMTASLAQIQFPFLQG